MQEQQEKPEMIQTIHDAACIIQPDLSIYSQNQPFSVLTGITGDTGAVTRIDMFLVLENKNGVILDWNSLFSKDETFFDSDYTVRSVFRDDFPASICIIPFTNIDVALGQSAVILILKTNKGPFVGNTHRSVPVQQSSKSQLVKNKSMPASFDQEQLLTLIEKQTYQLSEVSKTLYKVQKEINEELEMAKHVQISLMPEKLPEFLNISSAAIYIPASKVGGDFYDIILTPMQKLAVLIFDVSGHGVPAALIGAIAKMLFAQYIELGCSPSKVFEIVNKKLCEYIKTEHYLTAFLGIIDPIQNTMIYSRAGHVKPLIYNHVTRSITDLQGKGFFIGHAALSSIASYSEETVSFSACDKILFYTDGLTEGYNPFNEMYGTERLGAIFHAHGHRDLHTLLDIILQDQKEFRNGMPLRDDFTMLCMELGDAESLLKESGFTRADAPNLFVIHTVGEIERVCALILKAMDHHGFVDSDIKETKVCIYEMCINAIDHGNRYDATKRTLIVYKIFSDRIAVSIIDEGVGFDVKAVPNPRSVENIMKDSGRGLFIIQHFMDSVQFNNTGNRILVTKYLRKEV